MLRILEPGQNHFEFQISNPQSKLSKEIESECENLKSLAVKEKKTESPQSWLEQVEKVTCYRESEYKDGKLKNL